MQKLILLSPLLPVFLLLLCSFLPTPPTPSQLYKRGRYYPFYQIIIPGWYSTDDWGQMEVGEYNFTSE